MALALAAQVAKSNLPSPVSSVSFVGDERGLFGFVATVRREHNPLPHLHAALRRASVQIEHVRVQAGPEASSYEVDISNLDGTHVSPNSWAELQVLVLECVLGAAAPREDVARAPQESTTRKSAVRKSAVRHSPPRESVPAPVSGTYPIGSVTTNVEPNPTLLSTWMDPPWATAI